MEPTAGEPTEERDRASDSYQQRHQTKNRKTNSTQDVQTAVTSSTHVSKNQNHRRHHPSSASDTAAPTLLNEKEKEKEETDEEYRRRVYGTSDTAALGPSRRRRSSRRLVQISADTLTDLKSAANTTASSTRASMRRMSRQLSNQINRRRSSIVESLPDTPQGWATLVTTAASALLAYELRLQQSLTSPPLVFCQDTPTNAKLKHMLSIPKETGILSRNIKPSLLVGTRGRLASIAAYALPHGRDDTMIASGGNADNDGDDGGTVPGSNTKLRFRELMTMGYDGAQIAIDWELPPEPITSTHAPYKSPAHSRNEIFHGPITKPVVVILHGINNDASFGYIRSLMKACTDRGWVAAGYNFRGCGGVPLRTPRGYTGAYTGDLRCTINNVVQRMADTNVPIFIVGNSLGANLITKYLGEEGRAGTLPPNVAGGIALGNPLQIHSNNMHFPWAEILGMGVKKMILMHWRAFRKVTALDHKAAIHKALMSRTIGQLDCALAPYMIRNNPDYPFEVRVGYEDGEAYWDDASSHKYVQFVSVPMLKVTAQDDFLVYNSSLRKMSHCSENPNVFVVKTKCGGHLGWQEAPPDTGNVFGFGTSWADTATTEFIDAVIKLRNDEKAAIGKKKQGGVLRGCTGRGSKYSVEIVA